MSLVYRWTAVEEELQIRRLSLSAGRRGEELVCGLTNVSLNDSITQEAISYA